MTADTILVKNAHIFDGHNPELSDRSSILLADGEIKEISTGDTGSGSDHVIDAEGRTVMPGLIDNHIHVYIPTLDTTALSRMPDTYIAQYANVFLNSTLDRGFTTLRDIGGGDVGISRAIDHGMVRAPRFYYAGKIMSQTGGHGDMRPGWEINPWEQLCACGSYSTNLTRVVDDPFEMRRAVREELRKGSHCIKIMGSGGVASPNDPLHHTQFSEEEIRAAVDECTRQETYVSAHCHPAEAIRRCVEFGVRCIEHATLIDEETAQYVAAQGAYVVPTFAVIHALYEEGAKYGLPPVSQEKIRLIYGQAMDGLEIMRNAGVKMGSGHGPAGRATRAPMYRIYHSKRGFHAVRDTAPGHRDECRDTDGTRPPGLCQGRRVRRPAGRRRQSPGRHFTAGTGRRGAAGHHPQG